MPQEEHCSTPSWKYPISSMDEEATVSSRILAICSGEQGTSGDGSKTARAALASEQAR
jgi:hypothetical protein